MSFYCLCYRYGKKTTYAKSDLTLLPDFATERKPRKNVPTRADKQRARKALPYPRATVFLSVAVSARFFCFSVFSCGAFYFCSPLLRFACNVKAIKKDTRPCGCARLRSCACFRSCALFGCAVLALSALRCPRSRRSCGLVRPCNCIN